MSENSERFTIGDAHILRTPLRVSAADSTILSGYCYKIERVGTGRKKADKRSNHPLLCIPDELGTARDFHEFALWLQGQTDGPNKIYVIDRRGRGESERGALETYSLTIESDDLVSWCDALGLHHVDVMATGQGVLLP